MERNIKYYIGAKLDIKLITCSLLLIILPLLVFTMSCSNSAAIQSSSVTAIDQPWLENKPVTVSIFGGTIPETIVSDSVAIEKILSLVASLSYYETSSEVIFGEYPTVILEYPGRWIRYEVLNDQYITIIADGSTKEYHIPQEEGHVLYDYLSTLLSDIQLSPTPMQTGSKAPYYGSNTL